MRTPAEREKIIKQCICQMMRHRGYIETAQKYNDLAMMNAIKLNIIASHKPLIDMYVEGLQETMYPMTNDTAPAMIAALKLVEQVIEKEFPQTKEVADAIVKSAIVKYKINHKETRKNEKG